MPDNQIPEHFRRRIQQAKEKQLEKLDLSNDWNTNDNEKLTRIPDEVFQLKKLKVLRLNYNKINNIPESISNLSNLTILVLSNNPLESPPIEVAEKGIEAIREYFRQLQEEGKDDIYEAKLLIVGEAGAGKTTLAKKIKNPNYQLDNNQKSTEGIDIIQWNFPLDDEREFKVNIWDFGGQEIYHATHQFFLTKRSLYALVADTRKEDTDFYYWLNVVELLSDNSPLLIVKNEKQDRKREINDRALRGEFDNLKETLATNLKTNRGLEDIITNIKHYISNLPHIGTALPKTWVKVRQTIENDARNYISLDEYLDICEENGFTLHQDTLQLSGYLHDLGVCLHFQDEEDSLLYKTVIIKPEWGTHAVYKVLDNKKVINNQGRFTRSDLKNIWHEEKYVLMRGELLELMKKFQLCYTILENEDTFIAPQLLSHNQPEYKWDENNNLILRYSYPNFMPKGIVTRFIVVMHQWIEQQKYVWKSGVILNKDHTKAEVIEYYGRREIRIRVWGRDKRGLMTIVANELDKINDSYKRLKYQKLIPCNCEKCKSTQNPHVYEFNKLIERIANEKQTIECDNSPYNTVQILGLIDNAIDLNKLIQHKDNKSINFDGTTIQQLILQLEDNKNNINMTNTNPNRNININHGNYNETTVRDNATYVEGNYYNTPEQKQTLTEIAEEITNLLTYFEQQNPPITEAIQTVNTAKERQPELNNSEIIEAAIQATPSLKQRLHAAGKATYPSLVIFRKRGVKPSFSR